MRRILLVVAYDGTDYCGWQFQPNGITIEEVLNRELSALFHEEIQVIGASRTDSGVHAMGNVAVFDTNSRIPGDKVVYAINQKLPEGIRVQESREVPLTFHPRKVNGVKTYEYRIYNRKVENPILGRYSHFCYYDLDVEKMRKAAAYLVGEHDFKSFCTPNTQAATTVRTLYSLDIREEENGLIILRLSGSGFLYNMVRIIAGTLMRVGTGMYPPEHVKEILDLRDRQQAGPTAPAKGLTLISLEYEKEPPETVSGENDFYRYELDQRELARGEEHPVSRLCIFRSTAEEFAGVCERMIHQAYRNGAEQVLIRDTGSVAQNAAAEETAAGAGRLAAGQRYGLYVLGEEADGWYPAVFLPETKE